MVLPITIFAPVVNDLLAKTTPYVPEQLPAVSIDAKTINSVNTALSDIIFPDVQYSPQTPQSDDVFDGITNPSSTAPYLQIIWLSAAVLLFAGGIRKMQKFKKQIFINSNGNVDCETFELFLLACKV